jgi:hypothetical protein
MAGMAPGWDPWPAVDSRVDTERVLRAALARLRPEEQEILTRSPARQAEADSTITTEAGAISRE